MAEEKRCHGGMGNVNLEVDEIFKDGDPREDAETSERQPEDEGGDVRRAVKDGSDGPERYSVGHPLINFKDVDVRGDLVAIRYRTKESLHLRCRRLADYALDRIVQNQNILGVTL